MKFNRNGISLIAVLMFMLAATTASIVVYRYLGQENFLSGARLKQSEAYQASESGLDAVQSWLANRAVDAGDLVSRYISPANGRKSILLTPTPESDNSKNVLGSVGGTRSQNFMVYLTGVDENSKPMKLKFLSIGEARDNSKVSQSAIFSVDGLYRITMQAPRKAECEVDFKDAVFGNVTKNTQSNWSHATINTANYEASSIKTSGNFTATGNVTLKSGTYIGLDEAAFAANSTTCPSLDDAGDSYIAGNLEGDQLTFCGNVYVGGNVNVTGKMTVKGDLYVKGNLILKQELAVDGNLTIEGNFSAPSINKIGVKGDLLVWSSNNATQTFQVNGFNDSKIEGNIWMSDNVVLNTAQSGGFIGFATKSGSKLFMSNVSVESGCPGSSCYCERNNVRFSSPTNACAATPPTTSNKITGADDLEKLRSRVNSESGKVEDPLQLPEDIKVIWNQKTDALLAAANATVLVGSGQNAVPPPDGPLPPACVYLLKNQGGTIPTNGYCRSIDAGCDGDKFVEYLSACYEELRVKECNNQNPTYLYKGGDECYLPVKLASNGSIVDGTKTINGNFILIFDPKPETFKLPSTTDASKVLVHLPEGAGQFQVNNTKGNYFIFADKDIDKTSGNGHIKGTIFMANGSKIGDIVDTKFTFNEELFQALLEAGILESTNDPDATGCKPETVYDDIFIPVSSRLSVKLENKEISKEKAPEGEGKADIEKSILVMPRVVRLAKNDIKASGDFRKFYTYMYLNGAKPPNDGTQDEPTCNLLYSKTPGTLNTNGTPNVEGLYDCKFDNVNIRHSDFHVNVAGETGNPEIRINPPNAEIKKDKVGDLEGGGCVTVSLQAEEDNAGDHAWQVKIDVESGGNLWKVTPTASCDEGDISSGWLCDIPVGQSTVDALKVCPMEAPPNASEPRDYNIVLQISHYGDGGFQIDLANNQSTISIEKKNFRVFRDNPSQEYIDCPPEFKPSTWVSVNCPYYEVKKVNEIWSCEAGEPAEWSVNAGDACEVIGPDGNNAASGTIAAVSEEEDNNHFTVGLKWKSHKLRVSGLNEALKLTTSNTNVPQNERTLTCAGTTGCDVYHGANYIISRISTSPPVIKATCNSSFCPGTPIYLGVASEIPLTGNLTPTADVEMVLSNDNPTVTGCALTKTEQKIGADFLMSGMAEIISTGYECENNRTVTYSILGTSHTNVSGSTLVRLDGEGPYDVTVNVTCGGSTFPNISCTNQLRGVPASQPKIACAWEDNSTGNKNLSVGSKPKFKVSVTNGEATLCENASLSPEIWTSGTIQNQNPGATTDYIFEKSTPLSTPGSFPAVTANVTCGSTPLSATCPGFTVNDCINHPMTPYGSKPNDPYNTCLRRDNRCYICPSDTNCSTDWFWGGDFKGEQWISEGWLKEITCP